MMDSERHAPDKFSLSGRPQRRGEPDSADVVHFVWRSSSDAADGKMRVLLLAVRVRQNKETKYVASRLEFAICNDC